MVLHQGRNLAFSKLDFTMERAINVIEAIEDFRPKWMHLQPSIAKLLVDTYSVTTYPVCDSLKYIELSGEFLTNDDKECIAHFFKVPVVNQYGCTESNAIAYECPHGRLHCLADNVHIEVLKGEHSVTHCDGEVAITCLTNHAMPFIRYRLGDIGTLYPGQWCACGNQNPVIVLRHSRTNDLVIVSRSAPVPFYEIVHMMERVNKSLGYGIAQFQILQTAVDILLVRYVLKADFRGWRVTTETRITEIITQRLR